jgi:TIR domain/NB-ARC domain
VQQTSYDVYVSYSVANEPVARQFAEHLRTFGARVFIDTESLRAGAVWRDIVSDAIGQSRAVAVLVSASGDPQPGPSEEIPLALERAGTGDQLLIPVFLDDPSLIEAPDLLRFRGIRVHGDADLASAALETVQALETFERRLTSPPRAISGAIPSRPPNYIDTALTDLLMASARSSLEHGSEALYVTGKGGSGKTTLVAEVCRRLEPELDILWWIRASNYLPALADLAALGVALGLDETGGLEEQAQAVLVHLRGTTRSRVLVFDDVWDVSEIRHWLPKPSVGQVAIVVSRNRPVDERDAVLVVGSFDEDESLRFLGGLLQRRPPSRQSYGEGTKESGTFIGWQSPYSISYCISA